MSYSPYPPPPQRSGSTAKILIGIAVAVVVLGILCCVGSLIFVKVTGGGSVNCSTGHGCTSRPGGATNTFFLA
ncbi:hypothetical protein [Fodinicola feengrottensis]|uniref:Uncharacterized protein n=1 Tax=Fodinicola feengrottensis TaxID=435914 RepID=A0ABP4RX39_9ACTN|nr:hypothetical protein [Fodinicola feengrottensis]